MAPWDERVWPVQKDCVVLDATLSCSTSGRAWKIRRCSEDKRTKEVL